MAPHATPRPDRTFADGFLRPNAKYHGDAIYKVKTAAAPTKRGIDAWYTAPMKLPHEQVVSAFGLTRSVASWLNDPLCRCKASELFHRLKRGMQPELAITEADKAPFRSRFKGVTYCKQRGRWLARIRAEGTVKHLVSFRGKVGEILAAIEYDRAALAARGDNAELNFPHCRVLAAGGLINNQYPPPQPQPVALKPPYGP